MITHDRLLEAAGTTLRIERAGAAWGRVLGERASDLPGRSLLRLVHPGDRPLVDAALDAVSSGATRRFAARLVSVDGSSWLADWEGRQERGRTVVSVWSRSQDGHDEDTQESFHRFRALVERALDAFYVKGTDGRYLYINPAGAAAMGRRVEEVVGRSDEELWTATTAAEIRQIDRQVMESGEPWTYQPRRTDFQTEQHFFTRKYPYHDREGRLAGIMGVSHDVSEWIRAEEEARRTSAALRELVVRLPDVLLVHRDGEVVFANPAAEATLGEGVTGSLSGTPLSRWLPEVDQQHLTERKPTELHLHTPAGPTVLVEAIQVRLSWMGSPASLLIARNLAERRQFEEGLQRADRLAALGTLAAGMAHEINNPLTFAMLQLEELDAAINDLPEALGQPLSVRVPGIADALGRVSTIVHDLRLFVRGEQQAPGPLALLPCIERALLIAGSELKHRATVQKDLVEVPRVMGHEGRVVQVLVNLLVNAARAFPSQDVGRNLVRVGTAVHGHQVIVSIADNGPGIPEEIRARVFDPLFTTRPVGEGSGLGLWISHAIVAAIGGQIELASEVGLGTTVRIVLPALGASLPSTEYEAPPPAPAELIPNRRLRVLIVDDEPGIGQLMASALADLAEVVVRDGPPAAREVLAAEGRWDVLLLDVMMPEGSGVDLLAWIEGARPELAARTLLMTGGAIGEDIAQWLDARAERVLRKPFRRQALRDTVLRLSAQADNS